MWGYVPLSQMLTFNLYCIDGHTIKFRVTWARVTISPRTAYSHFKTCQGIKLIDENEEQHGIFQKKKKLQVEMQNQEGISIHSRHIKICT